MITISEATANMLEEQAVLVVALKAFNVGRLPEMLQYKYAFMAQNMFRFLRGSCHLFYQNIDTLAMPASPPTWIRGDVHLENFGRFKGNNKQVYFDLNDFDEAILAPVSWKLPPRSRKHLNPRRF